MDYSDSGKSYADRFSAGVKSGGEDNPIVRGIKKMFGSDTPDYSDALRRKKKRLAESQGDNSSDTYSPPPQGLL